jgi:hypothetical protein
VKCGWILETVSLEVIIDFLKYTFSSEESKKVGAQKEFRNTFW